VTFSRGPLRERRAMSSYKAWRLLDILGPAMLSRKMSDVPLPQQLRIHGIRTSDCEVRVAMSRRQTMSVSRLHRDRRSGSERAGSPSVTVPRVSRARPMVRIVHLCRSPPNLRMRAPWRLEVALTLEQRFQRLRSSGDSRFFLRRSAFDLITRMLIRARFQITVVQRLFGVSRSDHRLQAIRIGRPRCEVVQLFGLQQPQHFDSSLMRPVSMSQSATAR